MQRGQSFLLFSGLMKRRSLELLYMHACPLDSASIKALAAAIKALPELRRVMLGGGAECGGGGGVGPSACAHLASALAIGGVASLSLPGVGIQDPEVKALAKAVASSQALVQVRGRSVV